MWIVLCNLIKMFVLGLSQIVFVFFNSYQVVYASVLSSILMLLLFLHHSEAQYWLYILFLH